VTRRPEKSPSAEVRALGFRIARHVGSSHRILRRHERRHIHRPRHRRLPIAPRAPGALASHCLVNQSLCVGDLTPPANASDPPIELDVGGIACDATRIGLSCRVMIGRRAFEMILRSLAREGRRRCHKYHDQARDQSSHLTSPADFRSLLTHAARVRGRKMVAPRWNLPWRAKLADKPCRNRWQRQRINPIAFQAPKRARPFTVNRHHQHHQAAAVLASPRWIRLTHVAV
jgi:hypothetical protein